MSARPGSRPPEPQPAAPHAAPALARLRPSSVTLGATPEEGPARLLRIDPRDGAVCVFRDASVVAHYSRTLDPGSTAGQAFRVLGDGQAVPGRLRLSPDGRVLIWEPLQPLAPYVHHFVSATGLRDARGREARPHLSRFLTCDLMRDDICD